LLADLGPQLEALMVRDREAGRAQDQALRIGLYSWSRPMTAPPPIQNDTGETDEKT